ncbi:MAG: isoleucine--tRNA ligase [Candidatus Moranbacteria bacterium]|nr:isoleucine--tRNA ligase [Candidatus Moranbacteria bacterium]
MFKKIDPKQTFPKMEEEILKFWEEEKIFEKTLEQTKNGQLYTFYDGPPFATGNPHYGHLVGSIMKDVVPRFWTMKGRYVERKWGWDCHGLPIENIVEKELGFKHKKDIEEYGVEKFNEACRSRVLGYGDVWKKVINRIGRWADMENSYKTMDLNYMESVWWVFKQLWEKELIYEGYRSMHICTRCETTLSQQEVSEGYKDIKDLSVIAKFELLDEPGTFVLAWTTTPWTLIGNVALAVGAEIEYVKISFAGDFYVMAKNRVEEVFKEKEFEIVAEFKGNDLVGKAYKPLFDYYQNVGLENEQNGWKIYAADFVTTVDGVGVVHIAPAFGEDDMNLGKEKNLPFVQHVKMDGTIKEQAVEFSGMNVKSLEDHMQTDVEIIKHLAKNGTLFSKEKYEHSYPHCWRCDTPLINYATTSWFVNVGKVKEKALQNAENINWFPEHIKHGRFGKWLEGARDWSISRQRFWASVMPIWKCECGEMKVFGSVKELEEASGKKVDDLHKHVVDKITVPCGKCGQDMQRVPDVLDTWFDSGSMPYAQQHYPFENKEKFEKGFPAEYIAEGVDQTRAWFYYLHVIATSIKETNAFNNVIVNGIVLAEDGKKMSKKLQNYPDPTFMLDKYGADALRFYLMSSPVVAADNLNFKESDVADLVRGMFRMLWNSYSFFVLYADIDGFDAKKEIGKSANLLDKWMLSELHTLIKEVNVNMEKYDLARTARLFPVFIDNLSNWYIRRSRKRFWKSENDQDKDFAYQTLHTVLVELSKLMAPFAPFMSEEIYKNLTGEMSVHLAQFPVEDAALINRELNEQMGLARLVITEGLQKRSAAKIKVRQPLAKLTAKFTVALSEEFFDIIKDEVNVKEVEYVIEGSPIGGTMANVEVYLDEVITEELRQEGIAREIVRFVQEMRKEAGYEVDNRIEVGHAGMDEVFEKFGEMISKETLANKISDAKLEAFDLEKEFEIDGQKFSVQIKR